MAQRSHAIRALALSAILLPLSLGASRSRGNTEGSYSSNATVDATRIRSDFEPDGNLRKSAWSRAKWAKLDRDMSGKTTYMAVATRVATLWTDKYVYFAFSGKYETLNAFDGEDVAKERWELWNRDVVEVFLNPRPEHLSRYYEFEVAPNNQWLDLEITLGENGKHDASWNSGFEHATRIDEKNRSWSTELRIPFSALGVSGIKPGMEWRANFFRAAGKGSDSERKFLAWSSILEGTTFHVPSRFGILRFVK